MASKERTVHSHDSSSATQSMPGRSDELPSPVSGIGSGVRWSALAVIGRQASQMLCALILARILGPQTYGVISVATVYVTLTTLMLDQGLAAALVQRPVLKEGLAGAVATANLITAAILGGVTWFVAPLIASFFSVPELPNLLRVLGLGLVLKAAAIAPRALQQRALRFKVTALADVSGGVVGATFGICAAILGQGTWSLVWQVLATDVVIAAVLLGVTRKGTPNTHLRLLRDILPFSLRIFASNALAFFSRNSDNILVGRYLGVSALSHYSMAYRVLVIPVQMIGQTVNRVSFPTFSRLVGDQPRLGRNLLTVTELLAFTAIPSMFLIAVASPQLIALVLGAAWAATAPILTVLAVAGARETVFSATGSLMRAKGVGKLIVRYEVLATGSQVAGIVIGLQFGVIGVALGFTVVGFMLAPVLMVIQQRLASVTIRQQLSAILPAVHCSLWGAAAYLLVTLTSWGPLSTALTGTAAYLTAALCVGLTVHRASLTRTLAVGKVLMGQKPVVPSGKSTVA